MSAHEIQKIRDQLFHFWIALGLLSLFSFGTLWAGALAGLGIGLVRELSEAGGSRIKPSEVLAHFRKRDPWIDLAFWALGGLAAAASILI